MTGSACRFICRVSDLFTCRHNEQRFGKLGYNWIILDLVFVSTVAQQQFQICHCEARFLRRHLRLRAVQASNLQATVGIAHLH